MPTTSPDVVKLKKDICKCLKRQGYVVKKRKGKTCLEMSDSGEDRKATYRKVHEYARFLKAQSQINFLENNKQVALEHIVDGKTIDVNKIQPKLIEVKSGTKWEVLFKWWCFAWWSIPYERPIGRQMRFIVWDEYHKSIIGLTGLQSPILAWNVRDQHLSISRDDREVYVNQSLNAQRVGALPPYNDLLGGKLVASLLLSKELRLSFQRKYKNRKTVIENRILPNRLLFITTTGAFGKSPIYERLSYNSKKMSWFLGYTKGYGSFHIPDDIYQNMLDYLSCNGINIKRGYGSGPSRKLKLISLAMDRMGFYSGAHHNIKRGVYLFTAVENLRDVIHLNRSPKYINPTVEEFSQFWKERWILPRMKNKNQHKKFLANKFIEEELTKIREYG